MINGLCSRKDRSQTLAVMDQGIEEVEGARPNTAIESNRPRKQLSVGCILCFSM
jgi:hypothetical protein